MRVRLPGPADADRGLDQVHGYPQGERGMGGEETRRADRGGVPISGLEIALPQRREHPHLVGVRLSQAGSPRSSPSGYLVGQRLCCVQVTAGSSEDGQPVVKHPCQ
jgi:hypothetical protein